MLKVQLPKNRIEALVDWTLSHSDPKRLEQGWDLYHKGQLIQVELLQGAQVHAAVAGEQSAELTLHIDDYGSSECSCDVSKGCSHFVALMFYLYSSYQRPELLLQQLKQEMLIKQKQREARMSALKSNKKNAQQKAFPKPAGPPSAWHKYFEQQFYGYTLSQQHSMDMFCSAVKERLFPASNNWPPLAARLYEMHVLLFALRKIEQFYVDSKTSYMSYYVESGAKQASLQCLEQLNQQMDDLDIAALTENVQKNWATTLSMVSEWLLASSDQLIPWLDLYRNIWWKMGGESVWIKREQQRLVELKSSTSLSPRQLDLLQLANAHFLIMRGKDEQARESLESLHKRKTSDFFLYLQRCYHGGQWERMLSWLRWLLPTVQKAQQEDLRLFCQYWLEAVQHQQDDTEWTKMIKALLPRTYSFYTAYLLKVGRYQAWIDLQLSNRISPLELYDLDLQAVERRDPALLLPLYHQAVERYIAEKNRTAYRNATILLKKLHAIYLKLNEGEQWEEYIHRLSLKHARLRALLEELRKGKWIP